MSIFTLEQATASQSLWNKPESAILALLGLSKLHDEFERRRRYRADLKRMLRVGPHVIKDIGLTVEAARIEAAKPFWKS